MGLLMGGLQRRLVQSFLNLEYVFITRFGGGAGGEEADWGAMVVLVETLGKEVGS